MERKGLFKGTCSSTAARCRLQAAKVRGNACAHQGAVDEEGRRTEGEGEKHSLYVPPGTSRTVKRAVACTEKRLSTDMMGCVCVRECVCVCVCVGVSAMVGGGWKKAERSNSTMMREQDEAKALQCKPPNRPNEVPYAGTINTACTQRKPGPWGSWGVWWRCNKARQTWRSMEDRASLF